jgi:poly(A) polymerase
MQKKSVYQIINPPWMKSKETRFIIAAITKNGKEARFIGGCVRDAILNIPIHDIDIASQETPDNIIKLLKKANIKVVLKGKGIDHGTVMAVINHQCYEITTLRKDIKTDGRHASVEFTEDWHQDAARRDFTFNALSSTTDGLVFDYFDGIQDLSDRVIRFVGLAHRRIAEDYLRILRYFRFIAVYGMEIGCQKDLDACVKQAIKLKKLSAERVRAEFFKILQSNMPLNIIKLMYEKKVLEIILPHVIEPERLFQLIQLESDLVSLHIIKADPLRRIAALVDTDEIGASEIRNTLKLSKAEHKRLASMVAPKFDIYPAILNNNLQALIYNLGSARVIDLALIKWASMLVSSEKMPVEEKNKWLRIIKAVDEGREQEPNFPLKGREVLDFGIQPGPQISLMLAQVEDWWLTGGCKANRKECLIELQSVIERLN